MTPQQLEFIFDNMIQLIAIMIRQGKFNYHNDDVNELRERFLLLFPEE